MFLFIYVCHIKHNFSFCIHIYIYIYIYNYIINCFYLYLSLSYQNFSLATIKLLQVLVQLLSYQTLETSIFVI